MKNDDDALVDSKCLKALKKLDLHRAAENMAKEAEKFGAATTEVTLRFLGEEDEADAKYIARLTVTVERVE